VLHLPLPSNGLEDTHLPFSHSLSFSKAALATTVVMAFRSSWFMVTDTDELIGVLARTSRLPQYLMHAMLLGAVWVAETAGYDIMHVIEFFRHDANT
jgi:hypothetical protein